ncbi:MAG: ATP-binding protein [Planctomycetota bacterium]
MKLAGKLSLWLGAAVLAIALVVSVLLIRWLDARRIEERGEDLRRAAHLLGDVARGVLEGHQPPDELQARLIRLDQDTETRFTVLRADGLVLADSRHDPAEMDDHSERAEVLAAAASGQGTATRFSATLHARLLYVAVRVDASEAGRGPLGYVRAAVPLSELDRQLAEVRQVAVAAGAAGVLLVLLFAYLAARRVTRPLVSMTAAARALAAGQRAEPLPTHGEDELGELGRAFEAMATQLGERVSTIEAERAELTAILASMSEGLIAVDREGRILRMNEVAGDLLETDPRTSTGLKVADVTRIDHTGDLLAQALQTRAPVSDQLELEGLPRTRSLILRAAPTYDLAGALTGALLVIVDQTELRRLETVRRDFVANVSHELKTPLTAVLAQLETLIERPELEDADRRRFLERCLRQAQRLSTLVSDLLALSRIESTDTTQDFGQVDLRRPTSASCDGLRERAQEKGLTLAVDLPPQPVWVRGDPEYLRQVADNLLSNAVMYTPAEGRIDVRVRVHGEQALLEVQDTGIGIPRAERERIFERFYRVDRARSRDLGGTGLGLAIVKHLILAHGGSVEVDGSLGRGSTFRVRIPLLSEPRAVAESEGEGPIEEEPRAAPATAPANGASAG